MAAPRARVSLTDILTNCLDVVLGVEMLTLIRPLDCAENTRLS